jgi:hypothetical protein
MGVRRHNVSIGDSCSLRPLHHISRQKQLFTPILGGSNFQSGILRKSATERMYMLKRMAVAAIPIALSSMVSASDDLPQLIGP